MGFFDRMNPINAKLTVLLDKSSFLEGETITGRVGLVSDEAVHADEIRLEIRVTESYSTLRTIWQNGRPQQVSNREVKTLVSENARVSGALDITKGDNEEFPFSISIPPTRPTMPNGIIERRLKGVMAVKGRPDKTHEANVNVAYGGYGPAQNSSQVVVKEIVKVPCKYCGALIPIESTRCTNCGAKFTR